MPTHDEQRVLPYSAQQMFDLVADVARYPEFLPWVVATRIRDNSDTEMTADMVVGFKQLREKFTSKVKKQAPHEINVEYIDGPLKNLTNRWTFSEFDGDRCQIGFHVSFAFKNRLFEALAGQYFDRAFRKMVAAFETRANELYGSKSSSAHSAA
jgi:coenzyme Q-binding protein COQ10